MSQTESQTPAVPTPLPAYGLPADQLLRELSSAKVGDGDWRGGRTFAYVYYAGEEILAVARQAYGQYLSENGLSPRCFPSLARFEAEVLSMTAHLLGSARAWGSMTSGGSESIFLALKAARDWSAKEHPVPGPPQVVVPYNAHPAFRKACHYLGMEEVRVPLGPDLRASPARMEAAITERTILLVGSAPSYPHGLMDPIPALAELARRHNLLLHVDACVGGLVLPFVRRLGRAIPPFDLSVPGVTSISADLHKYGYTAKGASVILYTDESLFAAQKFTFGDWPGGRYSAPNLSGTRPGGAIAAAWAVMRHLGEEGYVNLTRRCMAAADALRDGIAALPPFHIVGDPEGPLFAFTSEGPSLAAIEQELRSLGWYLGLQQSPPSLHLTVCAGHDRVVEPFLADLQTAMNRAGDRSAPEGTAQYN